MEWWHIYLITRLDDVTFVMTLLAIVSFFTALFFFLASAAMKIEGLGSDWEIKKHRALRKFWLMTTPIAILFISLATAIPSKKDVAAMYLIPKIANNEDIQQMPGKFTEVMRLQLDQWLDSLRGTSGEK